MKKEDGNVAESVDDLKAENSEHKELKKPKLKAKKEIKELKHKDLKKPRFRFGDRGNMVEKVVENKFKNPEHKELKKPKLKAKKEDGNVAESVDDLKAENSEHKELKKPKLKAKKEDGNVAESVDDLKAENSEHKELKKPELETRDEESKELEDEIDVRDIVNKIEKEISKVVIGQKDVVRGFIRAILCDGHVLIEGVPGTAKTLIVRSLAKVMGCGMKRIQFTVDLLPTDIIGITSYHPQKGFEVIKGPIFANFILADEINRSPPKTQSALLEAMQEETVTIARESYSLPKPFFVMATQNPLEVAGVYTLPEAQVDRFLFKLLIGYPAFDEEIRILDQNVSIKRFEEYNLKEILSPEKIIRLQEKTKNIFTSEEIKDYILRIISETRNKNFKYASYVSYGGSPRASISMYIASKAEALMNGRDYVIPDDVRTVVYSVLRHRIILNYEAEAERISTDEIIKYILNSVRVP